VSGGSLIYHNTPCYINCRKSRLVECYQRLNFHDAEFDSTRQYINSHNHLGIFSSNTY